VTSFILFLLVVVLACALGLCVYQWLSEKANVSSLVGQQAIVQKENDSKQRALEEQLSKCKQAYTNLRAKAEAEIKRMRSEANALMETINEQRQKMQRWQVIVDAEAEAKRVIAVALTEATRLKQDADRVLSESQSAAKEILRKAEVDAGAIRQAAGELKSSAESESGHIRELARKESEQTIVAAIRESDALKSEAKRLLEESDRRAKELLTDADQRAREIAGEAYDVKENIGKYEKLLRAIKNELHGYGDDYIVPSHSLLDDLADEFAFAEAGQKLKEARALVKDMVKTGRAATCDYVEANRRETAIRFVVDAFNGKVDSTLALVKHDNYGKLRQQINDAFTIVNSNGEAFRNARISEDYLNSRLDELKWAVTANELKKRDQEEQRRLKERIREEQKAKREYERALRDARREEEAVQKAMARLQDQLSNASADERAKYETELQALQEKLKIAEEKGQRAISMAQQTRCGHVYIISNIGSFGEEVYKIGLTRRLEPLDRVRELGDSSVPFEFDVHALIKSDDAPALEHQLHRHFLLHQVNKVNHRKEFFRCDLTKIRSEVESLGLQAQWSMRADARDYRETLAIERKIASDPISREQWLQRQLELDLTQDDEELVVVGSEDESDG